MFKTNPPIRQVNDTEWELTEDLVYEGAEDFFTVPKGFKTDGASIPAALGWLIQNFGRHAKAAFLHDMFCKALNDDAPIVNSRDADGIFRRTLRELNVGFLRRWTMWCGVRWGALFNKKRRKGFGKDALRVVLVSAMVAPIIVPGIILVSILRFVDNVVTLIVSQFIK